MQAVTPRLFGVVASLCWRSGMAARTVLEVRTCRRRPTAAIDGFGRVESEEREHAGGNLR